MRCQDIQELFSPLADQELDPARASLVESHLRGCPQCHAEWLLFGKTMNWLKALDFVEPPPDLLPGIHAKLSSPWALRGLLSRLSSMTSAFFSFKGAGALAVALTLAILVKNALEIQPPAIPPHTRTPIVSSTPGLGLPDVTAAVDTPLISYVSTDPGRVAPLLSGLEEIPPMGWSCWQLDDPDIMITVHATQPNGRMSLLYKLLSEKTWQVRPLTSNLLLVTMKPDELRQLRALLQDQKTLASPPESDFPGFGSPRKTIVVALRIF